MDKSSILKNESGSKGKLSFYNLPITTLDNFHYKIALYMFSFLLRIFTKMLVKIMKRKGKIERNLFYLIYFHNKIHFVIFNIYIAGCIFLNARSILHLKYFPDNWFLFFDKWVNIFCFFFYWCDIYELFFTSKNAIETSDDDTIERKGYEDSEGYNNFQKAKKMLKQKENDVAGEESSVKGLNPRADLSNAEEMLPTPINPSEIEPKQVPQQSTLP